jgi:hypothetical protein
MFNKHSLVVENSSGQVIEADLIGEENSIYPVLI